MPALHFDRLQGIVEAVDRDQREIRLKLPNGAERPVRVWTGAYLHSLRNLDERQRLIEPPSALDLPVGSRLAASGLLYEGDPVLIAKEIAIFGLSDEDLVFEQPDWWSSQARDIANFWILHQLGAGDNWDPSSYRTRLAKTGADRDGEPWQETATLSRLIYGLSSTYLMNGNPRVLKAARELVRYQRERMRVESADGRYVFWLHALRDGNPVLPSAFNEDAGTIPLYEQIYCLAGLTQFYRITGDPQVRADIDKTLVFMNRFYWDEGPQDSMKQGYFSHIHPGTLRPADAGELNANNKNWNSVGDHLPAYLENYYLATRDPALLARLRLLGELIVTHFPDPDSPFVNERFDADWNPDHGYAWQQNRGVIGHNLKIAWCLTRLYHLTDEPRFLDTARQYGDRMLVWGQDGRRGGWFDSIEREPDPVTGRYELVWHDHKSWWQQEQGILANYILYAATGEQKYLDSARAGSSFYNLAFPDHDDGDVYFDVQANGTPYLLGDRADKGSHSKSGYHSMELTYFAHLYTNLLVKQRSVRLHFAPALEAGGTDFQVQPISLPPGKVELASVTLDGKEFKNFDCKAMVVHLPAWETPELIEVTLSPVE